MLLIFLSCSGEIKNDNYSGKWESEKIRDGNTIVLEIQKDGELYQVHKYTLDPKGELLENKKQPNKKYMAPLRDGVLFVTPLDKISYSVNDNKLYWYKWVFSKIE